MMKICKLTMVMFLFLGVISCEKDEELDFFELEYPPEAPWPSANDFEGAVIGAYWLLSGNNATRAQMMTQRLVLDAASDGMYFDLNFGADNSVSDSYDRANDINHGLTDATFRECYIALGSCTDAIAFLETGEDNNPYPFDINKDQVPRMEGELRFLRAYNWWILSTMFIPMYQPGGANDDLRIPFLEEIPGGFEDAVNNELATTQQIYDVMVSDLQRAIEVLPERFEEGVHHPSYQFGRANRYTAMALLARVYMQMNEFDLVRGLCDDIITYAESTGYYSLNEDPIEAFNKSFGFEGNGTEVLWFYLQYDGNGIGSWKAQSVAELMSKSNRDRDFHARRSLSASDTFLEAVGWQDPVTLEPTAEALIDKRYNQLYHRYLPSVDMPDGYETPNDGVYENQFATTRPYVWGDKYYRGDNSRRTNIPMFRLPEIYLTRAILRLRAGDAAGATQDVNRVRERAGLEALPTVTEDDIHNERWKELNFEGDRTNYLRSLHIDVPNGDRGEGTVAWDADTWEWRILERERELNNEL